MARKLLVLIAVLIAIPLTFAACGDDDDDDDGRVQRHRDRRRDRRTTADDGGGGETVAISETEFALDPSDASTRGRRR